LAARTGQFTLDKTRKGQFLCRDRRNLEKLRFAREVSSPDRIESGSTLQGQRTEHFNRRKRNASG